VVLRALIDGAEDHSAFASPRSADRALGERRAERFPLN